MGKLVKNIKSLLCITTVLFIFAGNLFSQRTQQVQNNEAAGTNVTAASSFENDTSYFAEPETTGTVQGTYKAPSTAGMIIKMIVVLALVIAALYGIMLFFKKKNNAVQSEDDFLRRVSSLNLSPGKSIEIVTLVDRGFILGVTDGSINLISEITDKEMISALNLNFDKKQNIKKPMNFSDVLEMFMPGKGKNNRSIYSSTEQVINNLERNNQTNQEEGGETNE